MAPSETPDERAHPATEHCLTMTDELARELYGRIRAVARSMMAGERPDHTLQATALAHEAWMRIGIPDPGEAAPFRDAEHAVKTLTRTMRRILVDHARARSAQKRAGDAAVGVDSSTVAAYARRGLDLVELDDLLSSLATSDEELATLVELRTIGGLSVAESARVLGVSLATAERRLAVARAWLARKLPDAVRAFG